MLCNQVARDLAELARIVHREFSRRMFN